MAIVKIDPAAAVLNDGVTMAFTAIDAADGLYLNFAGHTDTSIAVLLQNTDAGAAEVVVKQGDGIGGVVDIAVTVPASGFAAVALDSSSFMITKGDYKGYVHLTGPATVKVAGVGMP
ncbi:MAG: hypothetical protein IJ347_01155 [Faecalibacterium sp.]|nr:hypothetical protein [Faecalibacterium sp.]